MTTTDPTESVRGAIRAARVGDTAPAINLDTLGPTDSELENPTPLAEQIARKHPPQKVSSRGYVMCAACAQVFTLDAYALHVATVTERAVVDRRISRAEDFMRARQVLDHFCAPPASSEEAPDD